MDNRTKWAIGGMTLASISALAGCTMQETVEQQGYSFNAPDNGVVLMSESIFNSCGSWSPYNKVFLDDRQLDDVYYCTGSIGFPLYLYKGVFSLNLETLLASSYYKSHGENKTEVYVSESFKSHDTPVYKDYAYTEELFEDPTARFNEALDESETEGVLAVQEDIDSKQWEESPNDPDVLVSKDDGSAMYMGAMFASMAMLNNSSYYRSRGTDTSSIAVPASYMSGTSSLAYSNGAYYSDKGNIRSSNAKVQSTSSRNTTNAGKVTSTSGKASVSASKGGTSVSGSTSGRGSGGIGSGARGGGAG